MVEGTPQDVTKISGRLPVPPIATFGFVNCVKGEHHQLFVTSIVARLAVDIKFDEAIQRVGVTVASDDVYIQTRWHVVCRSNAAVSGPHRSRCGCQSKPSPRPAPIR